MLVVDNIFATPRDVWHTDPDFRACVLREWDKIEPYLQKDFIARWPD